MNKYQLKTLLEKFDAGTCTEEEISLLESWYLNWQIDEPFEFNVAATDQSLERIWTRLQEEERKPVKLYSRSWITWAAAVILIAGIGLLFYKTDYFNDQENNRYASEIKPGSNKAFLTLSNGHIINLSASKSGLSITENQLRYNDGTELKTAQVILPEHENEITIHTPKGGTYQITLPDGTKVWLNASTHLTYLGQSEKNDKRQVKLSGEAYFEVAKDKTRPFIVQTNKQYIEVLGTHFNVSNYNDDDIVTTTLLEGRVKINKMILSPGQQSVLANGQAKIVEADLESVMDWKNEDFVFKGEDFKTSMRKIARWYDVEIVYAIDINEDIRLGGWVSRKSNLSDVLKRIEITEKVHFKIEGRKIIVER